MMQFKKYYLLREDGMLLSTAFLTEEEAAAQTNMTDIEPVLEIDKVPWFIAAEGRWENRDPVLISDTNSQMRQRMYPPIGEQLDMLWHAMNRGEIPKAESFFNAIKAVKDEVPNTEKVFDVDAMPEE